MADKKKPEEKAAPTKEDAEDRAATLRSIIALEQENKSLKGLIAGASPEVLAELKAQNKEIKAALLKTEKDLAELLQNLKLPTDASGISDQFQVFKTAVLTFCAERELDPTLWKKLESL